MKTTVLSAAVVDSLEDAPAAGTPSATASGVRYDSLDAARAAAMLLGLVYHALSFRMFTAGALPIADVDSGLTAHWLQEWLHSFRMPWFFLIAGFFARLMWLKYSARDFLRRRAVRIGLPLLVGMATFVPAYVAVRMAVMPRPEGMIGVPGAPSDFSPPPWTSSEGESALKRPPVGGAFRPPPGLFDASSVAQRWLGPGAMFVQLNHLWFLWYLLLYTWLTPVLGWIEWRVSRRDRPTGDGVAEVRPRSVLALVTGSALLALPWLMLGESPFGWGLGLSPSIFRSVPDIFWRADPDMAFYALYYCVGWWLHRRASALRVLAAQWPGYLALGLAAFSAATWLSVNYRQPEVVAEVRSWRTLAYCLFSLATAAHVAAFTGLFERYCRQPRRAWRYLADAALWVYLAHPALLLLALALLRPMHLSWPWVVVIAPMMTAAAALAMYEWFVRRTFLARLFGAASAKPTGAR